MNGVSVKLNVVVESAKHSVKYHCKNLLHIIKKVVYQVHQRKSGGYNQALIL